MPIRHRGEPRREQEEVRSRAHQGRARAPEQAGLLGHGPRQDAQPRPRPALKADVEGPGASWTDERIAKALDTSIATVGRVRKRFCWQGLDAALERSLPERIYERSLEGRAEARLIALACSGPPEGRDRWSMRLLADKAVELGIVEAISHETV